MKNTKEEMLKSIMGNVMWINSFLLKINVWPEKLYGRNYHTNRKNIGNNYEQRLLKLTNHAIKTVPYYSKLYISQVSDINEFRNKIGFINRQTVAACGEEFISDSADLSKYVEGTTGGTSGKPLKFLMNKDRYSVELAVMHNMWNRVGWNYHTRGVLRNHHLPENKDYIINPITKEIIFDNFRLNHDYVKVIVGVLKKYKVSFIHAYPSAAYEFCKLSKDQDLDLSFVTSFLCGSEAVLKFQTKLITEELGIKIYNWYGHSEKLVLGGYCEHTDYYHIEPVYGYFELIDEDGRLITEPGKIGEIVGSTLYNFGMPLIRYRTGDYAEYVGEICPSCQRRMPLIKSIQGRWGNNLIYKKDGTYITTTALNLHSDLYKFIDGLQYTQDMPGELTVLLVKNENFRIEHEKLFLDHFKKSFGADNQVTINYVDKLVLKPNGKFELLISNYGKIN
jgi:phenylacetate-CoA ligase